MLCKRESIKPFLKAGLIIVSVCIFFGITAGFRSDYSMITALITQYNNISYLDVQYVFSINTYLCGFIAPLLAFLTIKTSNRFVLVLGIILSAIGILGMANSTSFVPLLISAGIFQGIGFAALSFGIIFGAVTPLLKENVSIVVATCFTFTSTFFGVLFVPIISSLVELVGFDQTMILFCILFAVILPLILLFTKKRKEGDFKNFDNKVKLKDVAFSLLKNKITIILIIFMIVNGLIQGITIHSYLGFDLYNAPSSSYPILKIVMLAGAMFFTFFCIKLKRKMPFVYLILIVYALLELCLFLMPKDTYFSMIIVFIGGFLLSAVYPLSNVIIRHEYLPVFIGTLITFVGIFDTVGRGINSIIGGLIYEVTGTFHYLLLIEVIIGVIGAIAIFCIARTIKSENKTDVQLEK